MRFWPPIGLMIIFGLIHFAIGEGICPKSETAAMESHIDALMAEMTLEEKMYQLFIVKPETVAGVKRNLVKQTQVIDMIESTQSYAREKYGIGLFKCMKREELCKGY